jgi:hypothetical protein
MVVTIKSLDQAFVAYYKRLSRNLPGLNEENHKNNQDSQSLCLDQNRECPEHSASDFGADLDLTWRVLRLRMENTATRSLQRVSANILDKRSRTVDKGWSSILGIVQEVTNPSLFEETQCLGLR